MGLDQAWENSLVRAAAAAAAAAAWFDAGCVISNPRYEQENAEVADAKVRLYGRYATCIDWYYRVTRAVKV